MVEQIMGQTLPTVISMGVVSQTTQTMFGKGKREKGKSRVIKGRRKIHVGSKGGWYVIKNGRKIYIPK